MVVERARVAGRWLLGVAADAFGCYRQCGFWNAAEERAVAEHSVGVVVERARVVGWRWECIWDCAWGAHDTATAGGFDYMGRAGDTLADLLGSGFRQSSDGWSSI